MPNICVLWRRSWERSREDQRRAMRSEYWLQRYLEFYHSTIHPLKVCNSYFFLCSELSNSYHDVVSLRNTPICPLKITCLVLPTALIVIPTNLFWPENTLSKLHTLYEWDYEQQLYFWISHLTDSFYLE